MPNTGHAYENGHELPTRFMGLLLELCRDDTLVHWVLGMSLNFRSMLDEEEGRRKKNHQA